MNLALVAGLYSDARTAAVDQLLHRRPGAVAIHHAFAAGRVERVVRDASGILDRTEVKLLHGCATCTIRDDVLRHTPGAPLLIIDLWDSIEPRPLAETLARISRFQLTCVHTALDAEHLPVDLCRGDRLADTPQAALPGDQRHLAEVLARQIEYAASLSLHGGDAEDAELAAAVLGHLSPHTPVVATPDVAGPALDVYELAERLDPATAQLPGDAQTGEVTTVVWRRLRPLHPGRLFAAMDELVSTTVRSRGRFWLASRHERMLAWDAVAGAASVEDAGPWLAALPEAAWELVSPARRTAAALDWNPIIGDRVQHLVFTGPDIDRDRLCALLDSCLIDQGDVLPGAAAWARYDDPFAPVVNLEER
ncbi:GTP-binding protein [Nonomuraea diastatica]|uniref:Cobalamin biosynthesis protein CobW n=1 Tax=Nonomuraea diastatica TaxID=1848329 RepID=A0A4R4WLL4_9ACTN|nr:GTP-binding protein [Nonomuraea diastatica]TDD18427.1 cobalamin biosynthesis protein CobW [Nonomuraea diastatica]